MTDLYSYYTSTTLNNFIYRYRPDPRVHGESISYREFCDIVDFVDSHFELKPIAHPLIEIGHTLNNRKQRVKLIKCWCRNTNDDCDFVIAFGVDKDNYMGA